MTTKFRGITVREGALIQGPAGWGEFSPFAEYGPREAARWLASALEAATAGWPAPVRDQVPVNVTVPAVGPDRAYEIAASSGCGTAKVKVAEPGQADADDIARVEAVRDALGPRGRVRVDVNGHWDVPHAVRMLAELDKFILEYAEQPCATLAELAELRRQARCRWRPMSRSAGPTTRCGSARPERPTSWCSRSSRWAGSGPRCGSRRPAACRWWCPARSTPASGLAAGLALAAALPDLPYACGLGTMSLLTGDVTAEPLAADGGALPVRRPAVDPAELARWEVEPGPWRDRAVAAAPYLGEVSWRQVPRPGLRRKVAG